ncbi:MAG: glycosyltransferase family 39 protein, partial [Ktedonobacterales bacterium]
VRHALPVASIPSSLTTLNPPLSIYLLIPFALLGTNPLPAMIAVALWNVLGIALCYVFASAFFERRIAVLATLFFAVSPAAIWYSRFLWQQNYLPPLLILWAMALYGGCIRGRHGMFAPAVALLVMSALLHGTALLLAPALVAGVLLSPHLPRLREYVYATAIVLLLLAPTILWEVVSNWSDVRILTSYSTGPAKVNAEVFFRLYQALGAPALAQSGSTPHPVPHALSGMVSLVFVEPVTNPAYGPASPYSAAIPLYIATAIVALLLFGAGWLALTRGIVLPALRLWRETPAGATQRARWITWLIAIWRGLRSDTTWRTRLLLWMTVTAPLVILLRHSSAIFTHYLIVLYPFAFITMAIGVLALARGTALLAARMRFPHARMRDVSGIVALALTVFLVVGQTAQTALSTYSVASGQFDAATVDYGYPLRSLEQADAKLAELQRLVGASEIYIAEKSQFPEPVDYMLVREHANRIGFPDTCLILPPYRPAPALIVASADSLSTEAL